MFFQRTFQVFSLRLARIQNILKPFKALKLVCQGEQTGEELHSGEELNEFNEGLPWWVKKKIIEGRRRAPAPAPPPPREFLCVDAEPQSPRNLSDGFVGLEKPRVKPVGSWMNYNVLSREEHAM